MIHHEFFTAEPRASHLSSLFMSDRTSTNLSCPTWTPKGIYTAVLSCNKWYPKGSLKHTEAL